MSRKLVLWFLLWLLCIQVSACLFGWWKKNRGQGKKAIHYKCNEKEILIPKAIVTSVIRQKMPLVAHHITTIVLDYLRLRPFAKSTIKLFDRSNYLLLSHDNRFLFVSFGDNIHPSTIKVWDFERNTFVRTFQIPGKWIGNEVMLSLSPDDSALISDYHPNHVNFFHSEWNPLTNQYQVQTGVMHWRTFDLFLMKRSIISRDAQFVLASYLDTIEVWCTNSCEHYGSFYYEYAACVRFLAVTGNHHWLLAFASLNPGHSSTVSVWNFQTGHNVEQMMVEDIWADEKCVIIDNEWMAIGWRYSGIVGIFSIPYFDNLKTICSKMRITSCAHVQNTNSKQHLFAIGGDCGQIQIWACPHNLKDRKYAAQRIHTIVQAHVKLVNMCCFTMNGEKLISAGCEEKNIAFSHPAIKILDSVIKIWDTQTGALYDAYKN